MTDFLVCGVREKNWAKLHDGPTQDNWVYFSLAFRLALEGIILSKRQAVCFNGKGGNNLFTWRSRNNINIIIGILWLQIIILFVQFSFFKATIYSFFVSCHQAGSLDYSFVSVTLWMSLAALFIALKSGFGFFMTTRFMVWLLRASGMWYKKASEWFQSSKFSIYIVKMYD